MRQQFLDGGMCDGHVCSNTQQGIMSGFVVFFIFQPMEFVNQGHTQNVQVSKVVLHPIPIEKEY